MGPEFGQQSVYRARIRAYNILSSSLTSWVHWTSFMACWVWKLYGFSHRPGAGWQQFGRNFSSKRNAKTLHRVLVPLVRNDNQFINWEFKKKIAWGKRAKWHKEQTKRMRFLVFAEPSDLELEHELMAEHQQMAEASGWWQSETHADAWIQGHKHIVRSHDRRHEIAIKVHRKCASKCMMSWD